MLKEPAICAIQAAWLATCLTESLRFFKAAQRPLAFVQTNTLHEILSRSQNSLFGKKHGFSGIRNISDFQKQVPISSYENYQEYIQRIARGENRILTDEPVGMFEITSGSSSASKLIPYTEALQMSFNRALHPWLIDIYRSFPRLWGGTAYWVVTPKAHLGTTTEGGIKIGFADDSEYFGRWSRKFVEMLMAAPVELAKIAEISEWKYQTLLHLLADANLRLISLWNPTFLNALFSQIAGFQARLIDDLRQKAGQNRAAEIYDALAMFAQNDLKGFTSKAWPKLGFISAWTEAEANADAKSLATMFPQAFLQTKGILATECPVTIPVTSAIAPVLAVRSAFFEFIDVETGEIRLASQLATGKAYSLVVTTFGGLFRYRLCDLVEVAGYWKNLPCFKFLGKEGIISDLCGEKLNADHIKQIFASTIPRAHSTFIAPEKGAGNKPAGYVLYIGREHVEPGLSSKIEGMLRENFHYNWCIENGQLQALRIMPIDCNDETLARLRLERQAETGGQFSTSKSGVLSRDYGWTAWFNGRLGRDR